MGEDFSFLGDGAKNLLFFNKMGRVGIEPTTN
jgi:hypothetical protein